MPLLSPTAAKAMSAPVETSLRVVLLEYELDIEGALLLSLNTLSAHLEYFGLTFSPPIGMGGLEEPRVLSPSRPSPIELALDDIASGETADTEFKSSLLLDMRKLSQAPGLALSEYRLDALIHSALKTIAAFANTDGGVLYVGVEDNSKVCGLALDFELANPKRCDYDGWEQFLRGQIESRFVDGKSVNAYVRTECILSDGLPLVKIQTAARNELTFIRKPGSHCELYIRSGTRSVPVDFEDIGKHYAMTRTF